MSVHYKFKNTINYDAVKFDGVYILASDLKSIIVQQKKLGHSELQVENEETGQLYIDDQLIPKNTNIIVSRLPFANSNKRSRLMANQPYPSRFSGNASSGVANSHHTNYNNHHSNNNNNNTTSNNDRHKHSASSSGISHGPGGALSAPGGGGSGGGGHSGPGRHANAHSSNNNSGPSTFVADGIGGGREALELVTTKNMTEEEKIKYIQSQSTKDFDPTRYARGGRGSGGGRGSNRGHFVPGPGYTCRKCGIPGHSIYDCKMSTMHKVKRSSGIPRDFLKKVDSKEKGALMTPSGEYAVPYIDHEAYNNPKVEKAPFFEDGS